MRNIGVFLLPLLIATGCQVKTPLPPPNITLPTQWDSQGSKVLNRDPDETASSSISYNKMPPFDSLFNSLYQAMYCNYREFKISILNEESASLLYDLQRTSLLPNTNVGGSYQRQNSPNASTGKNATSSSTSGGFNASWEIDFFGRLRSQIDASKAQSILSSIDRYALQQSLAYRLANTYFTLRSLQQQREILHQHITVAQDLLKLVNARLQSGLAAQIDLSRAEAQLALSKTQLPPIEEQWRNTIYEISFLTGLESHFLEKSFNDADKRKEFEKNSWWNSDTRTVPYYLPTQVLLARPDVLTAEQQVLLQQANWATIKADFFPRFLFLGGVGYSTQRAAGNKAHGPTWNIGPQISWSLLDFYKTKKNSKSAEKLTQAALLNLELTIETAMKEVQQAIVSYDELSNLSKEMSKLVFANEKVTKSSRELYEKGLQPLTNYLDDEDQLLTSSLQKIQAQTNAAIAALKYQKASGFFIPNPVTGLWTKK